MAKFSQITDKEFDNKEYNFSERCYSFRSSVRSVVVDENNNIPLLYVAKSDCYTLPGGGIDFQESIEKALIRETREEAACEISDYKEIATIFGLLYSPDRDHGASQLNYCFLCKLKQKLDSPQFTPGEIEEGYKLEWVNINEAISKFKSIKSDNYGVKFVTYRDLFILETALEYL